jgi:hypothetical protein
MPKYLVRMDRDNLFERMQLDMEMKQTTQVLWAGCIIRKSGVEVDNEKVDGLKIKMAEPGQYLSP